MKRLCAAATIMAAMTLPTAAKCPSSVGNGGLDGHWVITITEPGGSRFVNLVTFTPDGNIEIFASFRQTQSIGRGTYCRTGVRQFTLAIVQLGYDPSLGQNAMATVRSVITVNAAEDEFTGPNRVQAVDPRTGAVLFAGDGGSVIGKRVKPEVP